MSRTTTEKVAVTVVLVAWWIAMPQVGYVSPAGEPPVTVGVEVLMHAVYMLCHGNVWHLCGNLFAWWLMGGRLWLKEGVLTAFVMSWLPVWYLWGDGGMTLGFSGVLFAIMGMKWGSAVVRQQTGRRRKLFLGFCWKALLFALVGAVIPHVNWCLHLYCLMGGFAYGWARE